MKHVATPLMNGNDITQIATDTGLTRQQVTQALEQLKTELRQQSTAGGTITQVVYTRPVLLEVDATDLETTRWRIAAANDGMSLAEWIRQAANKAAA